MPKRILIATSLLCVLSFVVLAQRFGSQLEKRPQDSLVPSTTSRYMATEEYREAHELLEDDFWRLYEPKERDRILSQSKSAVVRAITSDKDFSKIAKARFWCAKNINDIIPALVELIKTQKLVGLSGSADVIIWERIEAKDLEFYGHGWVVQDDLFTVAGRASWLLREITGQTFAAVSMKSTPEQLGKLSETWLKWYEKNKRPDNASNKSLDRSGGSVFLIKPGAAKVE